MVRPGIEPETSPTADWRLTNWANQAAVKWCEIKPNDLEECASDRPHWRATIQKAAVAFEVAQFQNLTAARNQQ